MAKEHMSEKLKCLREITGTCSGCNIIEIAILGMRWKGMDISQTQNLIKERYCPEGVCADPIQHHLNKNASHALGQRQEENIDFQGRNRPLRQNPSKGRRYSKMSKKSTGRFFTKESQVFSQG